MHRHFAAFLLAPMLLACASLAQAVGFGRVENATVLGQPLDFYASMVLAPDENIDQGCISVEVQSGDNVLPANALQVRVIRGGEGAAPRLRVQSTVRIDEPVISVQLNVSCGTRLSRRFVVLVDPPTYSVPQVAVSPAPSEVARAEPVTPAPAVRPSRGSADGTRSAASARDGTRAAARSTQRPARRAASAPRPPRVVALAPASPASAAASTAAATPMPGASAPVVAAVPRAVPRASAPGGSRLVLDPGAAGARGGAPAQAQATPPASSGAESDAFAAEVARERERLKQLEATVERLRGEQAAAVAAQQAASAAAAVPTRVRDAQRAPMSPLIYALLAAVILLLLAVIALMVQQARLRREVKWWSEMAVAPDSRLAPDIADARRTIAPPVPATRTVPGPISPEPESRGLAPAVAGVTPVATGFGSPPAVRPAPIDDYDRDPVTLPAAPRQSVMPVPLPDTIGLGTGMGAGLGEGQIPARELSVEELMDLEQQADFFVVLGQDEAAVDLLMSMVRSSGGSSPMPYLKLLEIYRRTGERGPYDRIRDRFNQRFNGVAPVWEDDPASGLDLEGYPEVLAGLQALWGKPLEAAVALEAMLFRRGGHLPPFDLPAFAELLFLHRLSHDLFEQERSAGGVDLLLPLDSTIDAHLPITLDPPRTGFDASGLVDFDSMPRAKR